MTYSGSCNITTDERDCKGPFEFVNTGEQLSSKSIEIVQIITILRTGSYGCESDDFPEGVSDYIALLWFNTTFGNCSLYDKVSIGQHTHSHASQSSYVKALNAESAGAMAVVFMLDSSRPTSSPPASRVFGQFSGVLHNELSSPSISSCLTPGGMANETVTIPVLGVTYQIGEQLQAFLSQPVSL